MATDRELVAELAMTLAALKSLLAQLEAGLTPLPAPRLETVKGQGRGSKKPRAKLKSV